MNILNNNIPNTYNDLIGIKSLYQKCRAVCTNHKPLLILGPSGSGKTILMNLLCTEFNYNVLYLCKDSFYKYESFIKNETIESFFDKRHKCICIDNIETILGSNEKISTSTLITISKFTNIQVIMTCNSNDEKKANELKKYMEHIKIHFPSPKESFVYIMNIFENMKIEYNSEKLLEICNKYNGCIREICEQYISRYDEKNQISQFRNSNMFESVSKFLSNKNITEYDICYLLNDDVTMRTFLLFENLPEEVYNNRCAKNMYESCDLYSIVLKTYISTSEFENCMYHNHDWWYWDLIHLLRIYCIYTELNKKKRITNSNIESKLRLSQIMSKTSHKQILNKKSKTLYDGMSQEIKYIIIDDIIQRNSEKERKTLFNTSECNFMNTYEKYFS